MLIRKNLPRQRNVDSCLRRYIQQTKEANTMRRKQIVLLALLTALLSLFAATATAEAGVFTLPSSMKTIKAEAFYGDDSLYQVILPNGVTTIGSKAFAYSTLQVIHLPASLTSIADDAFLDCSGITVTADAGSYAYEWAVENGYIVPLTITATADTMTIITGVTCPSGTFTVSGGTEPYSIVYSWYADGYEYPQQENYDYTVGISAGTGYWAFDPCNNEEGTFRVEFECTDGAGNTVTYTLSGFTMQAPEPDDSISVSSSSTSSPYTVTVVSSGSWTASADVSWLTLSKTSGSAGTTTVKVTAAANTTGYDRTGTVTFTCGTATDTFTVTQEGELSVPTNFTATLVNSGLVRLTWDAVPGAEEYKVYYGYSADDLSEYVYVTDTTVDIAVFTIGGSSFYCQVRAVNSNDVSDKTEILEVILAEEEEPYLTVTLSDSSVSLDVGDTYTLTCTVDTNAYPYSEAWTSSNTSVATVSSSGVVTAVGSGTATITCTVTGEGESDSATCKVTVTEVFVPEYIYVTLDETSVSLEIGDYIYLYEEVDTNLSEYETTWTSSNTSVAKVSSSGKVTAVSAGTATITCTVSGNGESDSATCKVTVVDTGCTFDVSADSWTPGYSSDTETIDLTLHGDHDYTVDVVQYNSENAICDDSSNKLAEWLSVTEYSSSIKLSAGAHYAAKARKATVTVSCDCGDFEYDISVTQSGGAPAPASVTLSMAGGGGFTETSTTIDDAIRDHSDYKLLPGDTFGATVSGGSYARRITIRIHEGDTGEAIWEDSKTTTGTSGVSASFSCVLPSDLEPGTYRVNAFAANAPESGADGQHIKVSVRFTVVGDGSTADDDEIAAVLARADEWVEYTWVPKVDIPVHDPVYNLNGSVYYYKAGNTYYGIPYSYNSSKYFLEDYISDVANTDAGKGGYVTQNYTSGGTAYVRLTPTYGADCSCLVNDCLWYGDSAIPHTGQTWVVSTYAQYFDEIEWDDLAAGDIVRSSGHVMLVYKVSGSTVYVVEQRGGKGAARCESKTARAAGGYYVCGTCTYCKGDNTNGTVKTDYTKSDLADDGYLPYRYVNLYD